MRPTPTHFARHACNFRSEAVELVHHRIDRVFEFENFALNVYRDFLGEITVGDRGCYFGDVAYLTGQIAGHEIHVVG